MDFSELKSIDLNLQYAGTWPSSGKVIFFIIVFMITLFIGYFFILDNQFSAFIKGTQTTNKLKFTYQSKYQLGYNLAEHEEQVRKLESQLLDLLNKLPMTHETPDILDDITVTATSSGVRISMIKWGNEIEKEFYTELPIYIDVIGEYHQIGKFVSDIAKLSRIVSLHEFEIKKIFNDRLSFHVVAKTYRYKGR